MKGTWMLRAAGILCIIAGVVIVVLGGIVVASWDGTPTTTPGYDPAGRLVLIIVVIPSIIMGIIAIVGGICALRRKIWGLALAGSIALVGVGGYAILRIFPIALVGFGIAGLFALAFVVSGKGEFR